MCSVRALRRSMMMSGLAGTQAPLGDCALVEADGVLVVLASVRCQGLDVDLFTQLGCDVAALRVVVVKSSQHFYASFAKIASQTIYVDTPSALSLNLASLHYRKIRRPKWPLDPM
jgi:microcystin degradation protein MlrC